jgi:peptidoglycan pentaglycine glycine transferase (the first glycine)
MIRVEVCSDKELWDEEVVSQGGHPLQLWGWGEVKAAYHWRVERVFVYEGDDRIGAAQILLRSLPGPFKYLAYIPRGPVAKEAQREVVLNALGDYCKKTFRAAVLTVEPDWEDVPVLEGWRRSENTILLARTLILNLTMSEDDLLSRMTKKTRQYIRKSANDEVTVRQATTREEVADCLKIYKETAKRAGFPLHDEQYYYDIFDKLGDFSPVFIAFHKEIPIAFLWLAISEATAFELYGGMNEEGQRLRANYTLKWHAIRTMKKWGVQRYDMNGLLNDGVSTFKQGFADHENMLAGTYDKPLSPLYYLWSVSLPLVKRGMRLVKKQK